jgi:hypothetical protein
MNGIRHPFTGALYEPEGDGFVLVTLGDRSGLFSRAGQWLAGDLREADVHLCGWTGSPRAKSVRLST